MTLNKEQIYKKIFELLPDLILVTNKKGIIVYGNNQIVSWLGYGTDEIVGHSVLTLKFITTRSKLLMGKNFFRRIAGKKIEPYIIDFRAKNGDMKSGLVRGKIIKDENGKTLLNVSLVTNVTKETNKKRKLESIEKKYKYLFDNLIDGFSVNKLVYDDNGNPVDFVFLEINNAFEEVVGIEAKDLLEKRMGKVIPKEKKDIFLHLDKFANLKEGGQSITFEFFLENEKKWFKITAYSIIEGEFVTIFQDITNQKRVEEELHDNKEKLIFNLQELEKVNKQMIGRELEMVKLKQKLKE